MTDPTHTDTSGGDRPVSGAHTLDGPFLALHDQLMDAIDRHPVASLGGPGATTPADELRGDRFRRLQVLAAAAAIVVAVVAATFIWVGSDSGTVAADVTVRRDGDTVIVDIRDDVAPEDLVRTLADAGVTVRATGIRTGPSKVGRFLGITGSPGARLEGATDGASQRAVMEAGATVEIRLGVRSDDLYDVPTDAFAEGELLAGPSLAGRTWAEVGSELRARAAAADASVRFFDVGGQPVDQPRDGDVIESVEAIAVDEIMVRLGRTAS